MRIILNDEHLRFVQNINAAGDKINRDKEFSNIVNFHESIIKKLKV